MEANLSYRAAPVAAMHEWGVYRGADLLDVIRTEMSAHVIIEALNAGRCYLDIHLPLGCRVQPVAVPAG